MMPAPPEISVVAPVVDDAASRKDLIRSACSSRSLRNSLKVCSSCWVSDSTASRRLKIDAHHRRRYLVGKEFNRIDVRVDQSLPLVFVIDSVPQLRSRNFILCPIIIRNQAKDYPTQRGQNTEQHTAHCVG